MAVAIRSLNRRRRTTQRGKSMSQSQRWGKVTIMPTPEGIISTSAGPAPAINEEVVAEKPAPKKKTPKVVVEEELPVEETEDGAN